MKSNEENIKSEFGKLECTYFKVGDSLFVDTTGVVPEDAEVIKVHHFWVV